MYAWFYVGSLFLALMSLINLLYGILPLWAILWYQWLEYNYFSPFQFYFGFIIMLVLSFDDLFIFWNASQEVQSAARAETEKKLMHMQLMPLSTLV